MGRGFYYAFETNQYALPTLSNTSPRIALSYFDEQNEELKRKREEYEATDRLSKGLATYKEGPGVGNMMLFNKSWPKILRQHPNDNNINAKIKNAITYPLTIREDAGLPINRTWTWEVQVITTGLDGKCQTAFEGNDTQIISVNDTGESHAVAVIGGEPGEANETLDTRIKACFTEAEYTDFLNSHELEEEIVEPLITRNTDQVCFDIGEISEEEIAILGDPAIQQLQGKNDDLIEWVNVTYGEEAWLQGDSWRGKLIKAKGGN